MCDIDEPDYPLKDVWRRARKEHTCYACRETIARTHVYHYSSGIDRDGEPYDYKHCARCWKIFEALWADTSEGVQWDLDCGEVWEDPPDQVAALAFALPGEILPGTPISLHRVRP